MEYGIPDDRGTEWIVEINGEIYRGDYFKELVLRAQGKIESILKSDWFGGE